MSVIRILVAEDDPNIREGLIATLESEGYRAEPAEDGNAALRLLEKHRYDLLLLDIMMPGMNGFEVCRKVRQSDETLPVIMLTAKGEEIDKVLGLELGADDYVTKPFSVRELLARVAAMLRRSKRVPEKHDPPPTFMFGPAEIDTSRRKATVDNRSTDLSAREVKLLQLFKAHAGEVLERSRILDEVWGIKYYGTTRTLDQHIAQLRKKIEANPQKPTVIITVHGTGYRYVPDGG